MDSQILPMERAAIPLCGAEDRISGLPDEILHSILVRLQSAAAAARTSVLSRRWRGVWAYMPELVLGGSPAPATPAPSALLDWIDAALNSSAAPTLRSLVLGGSPTPATPAPSALLDSIDAALNSSAAPTLRSLEIDLSGFDQGDVPAHRISPWLRFASQRVAGKLSLHLHPSNRAQTLMYGNNLEELALPICERATEMDLYMASCNLFLGPPPPGSGCFSLLTDLKISCAEMDGGELGRLVSSLQCPRLRKLHLFVVMLRPVCNISISSESLRCLDMSSCAGKLEVTAPVLQEIVVRSAVEACIVVAPKLEKVTWFNTYDPCRHQFVEAGRHHLQSLSIMHSTTSSTRLMDRFDTTSELTVYLGLMNWQGIAGYMTFLKEMEKLPTCETLVVNSMTNHHAFAPMVLHLLRGCSCIRKFKLIFNRDAASELPSCTMSDCPCHLPENYSLDDITFNSLEEIEISRFTGSAEQVEFVELLLSRCNTVTTLNKVDFTVPFVPVSSEMMEVVQSISSMCHPNSKVQFNVHTREELEP